MKKFKATPLQKNIENLTDTMFTVNTRGLGVTYAIVSGSIFYALEHRNSLVRIHCKNGFIGVVQNFATIKRQSWLLDHFAIKEVKCEKDFYRIILVNKSVIYFTKDVKIGSNFSFDLLYIDNNTDNITNEEFAELTRRCKKFCMVTTKVG